MPSSTDNTLNKYLAKPKYDTVEDMIRQQRIREAEYILEPTIPAQPDRETELEYLDWLQEDLKAQPWINLRQKKTFGPKRIPYNNKSKLVGQYRLEFFQWWVVGALLGWPLATRVGNRMQRGVTGVPAIPMPRWSDEFINVNHKATTWYHFRKWSFLTCFITGVVMARMMTDDTQMKNREYQRPDFKPKAAMVKDTSMIYDDNTVKQLQVEAYKGFGGDPSDKGKSTLYRFFFPQDANWEVQSSPHSGADPLNSYNPADGSFPLLDNRYADHKN